MRGPPKEQETNAVVRVTGEGRTQLVARSKPSPWTRAKQIAFLEQLALSANVAASARAIGLDERGAYKLRRKDAGFRAAWADALSEGYAMLEVILLERAMHGTEKPVFHAGTKIDVVREYSDASALRLLAAHRDAVSAGRAAPKSDPKAVWAKIEATLAEVARRLAEDDPA